MRKILWLFYRKLRPAFGISFAFVLLTSVFLNLLDLKMMFAAVAFLFIELFGAFYNDYWDVRDDTKNRRNDKFITFGVLTPGKCALLSYAFATIAFILLLFTYSSVMLVGLFYLSLGFLYSHEKIRMKGKLTGYTILSSPFFALPLILAFENNLSLMTALPLSFFTFFQYMYILSQKDSTDTEDRKNVFTVHGWKTTGVLISLFGSAASLSLLLISIMNPLLTVFWAVNTSLKFLNIRDIVRKCVKRTRRSNIILLDFVTEYMYIAGGML